MCFYGDAYATSPSWFDRIPKNGVDSNWIRISLSQFLGIPLLFFRVAQQESQKGIQVP